MEDSKNIQGLLDLLFFIIAIYLPFLITKRIEKDKYNRQIGYKSASVLNLMVSELKFNKSRMVSALDTLEKIKSTPIKYNRRNIKYSNRKNYQLAETLFNNLKYIRKIDTSNIDYLMKFDMEFVILSRIQIYNSFIEDLNQEVERIYKSETILNKFQSNNLFNIISNILEIDDDIVDEIDGLFKCVEDSRKKLKKSANSPIIAALAMMTLITFSPIIEKYFYINIYGYAIIEFLYYALILISFSILLISTGIITMES